VEKRFSNFTSRDAFKSNIYVSILIEDIEIYINIDGKGHWKLDDQLFRLLFSKVGRRRWLRYNGLRNFYFVKNTNPYESFRSKDFFKNIVFRQFHWLKYAAFHTFGVKHSTFVEEINFCLFASLGPLAFLPCFKWIFFNSFNIPSNSSLVKFRSSISFFYA